MTPLRERSWLHDSVEVRSSSIHRRGLFTTRAIAAGTLVLEIGGVIIDDSQLDGLIPPYSSVGLDKGRHLLIQADDPVRFGNHGCDPNLWMDGALREIARRDIAAEEELTVDYATHTTRRRWRMLCTCGSDDCRVLITGEDWKLESLQRRYRDHWNPQLLKRRDRSNEW